MLGEIAGVGAHQSKSKKGKAFAALDKHLFFMVK